jgi:hypothetical protein
MEHLDIVSSFVEGAPPGEVRSLRVMPNVKNGKNAGLLTEIGIIEQLNDVIAGKDLSLHADSTPEP